MKYRMYAVLAIAAIFLAASLHETSAAWGQETRFVLKVMGNNKPVAGAKVYVDGEFKGITDKDGSLKTRLKLTQKDIKPGSRIWDVGGYNGYGGGRCVCIYFQVTLRIEKEEFATYEDFMSIPYNLNILTYFAYLMP